MNVMRRVLTFALLLAAAPASAQITAPGLGGATMIKLCAASGVALTSTGTTKQTLATCTIPAGSLTGNMWAIQGYAFFKHAANANATTSYIDIGGTSIIAKANSTSGDVVSGNIQACTAGSASTLVCTASQLSTGGLSALGNYYVGELSGYTFSNAIDITVAVTTGVQAGDMTLVAYGFWLIRK